MTVFDELNDYADGLRNKGYAVLIEHYEDGKHEIISVTITIDKKRNRGNEIYG